MGRKYDILLIQPSTRDRRMIKHPPFGLLSVAALPNEKGITIKILDGNIVSKKNIQGTIVEADPKIIGFSTFTGRMLKGCVELSKFAKKYSQAKIVWGGIHATLLGQQVIREDYVDIVSLGEGDFTLYEIWANLDMLSRVKGIIYKAKGCIVQTERRPAVENLDTLPRTPWELIDIEKYVNPWADARRTLPIMTSRGCTGECGFCYNNIRQYRSYSAGRVIGEINKVVSLAHLDGIRFDLTDDFIGSNPDTAIEIAYYMKRLNLKWSCDIRAIHANDDTLKTFKKCGCRYLLIGVESGSDRILKFINKHQTTEHVIRIFDILNKLKIRCTASFMFDFPTETEYDINQSFSLMKRVNSYITAFPTQIYPKTKLFNFCIANNMQFFPSDTLGWAEYDYDHIHGFSNIKNLDNFVKWKLFYFTYLNNFRIAFIKHDWFTFRVMVPKIIKDVFHR